MKGYADILPDVVGDDIGEDEADELSKLLHEAHDVERLYGLNAAADKAKQLPEIDTAAGQFQALANSVRAGYRGRRNRAGGPGAGRTRAPKKGPG